MFLLLFKCDFLAEVDIVHQLGVDGGLSVVHEVAESLPVVLRGDFVAVLFGEVDGHGPVGVDGG